MPDQLPAILYLRRNGLEIYPAADGSQVAMEYPWSAYKDLKIIDQSRLEDVFRTFLLKHGVNSGSFLIVLADEILHKRTIQLRAPELDKKAAADFYAQIPFRQEIMARKEIRTLKELNLFAFNNGLFLALKNIIGKNGGEVKAVIPASVFGFTDPIIVFTPEVHRIFTGDERLLKTADFLTGLNESREEGRQINRTGIKRVNRLAGARTFIFWLLIGVALTAGYLALVLFLRAKNEPPSENLSPKPELPVITVTLIPTITVPAELKVSPIEGTKNTYLPQKDLTASVLNGGNIPGLAGTTRDRLQKAGYSTVTIGNKTDYPNPDTEVIFSSRVSPDDRRQVLQTLAELVKTTAVIEPDNEPILDISIIIGKGL